MKNKISLFGVSLFVLVFLMSAVSAVTLANWDFEDSDLVIDSGTGTLTISDSRTATYPIGNTPSAVAAMSTIGWDVADRYIELAVSTLGYEDITLKLDEQASLTGPIAFQIQYSSDGTTFINLGSTTSTVSAFTANPMHTFNFSSITALDNNANTEFRIIVLSADVGSNPTGTLRLDNLLIEGTVTTVDPQEILDCSENPGKLEIKKIDFNNDGFSGREFGSDDEWFFLDEIEVEIEVENDGDWDVDDISLEWGIYDIGKQDWVIDLDEEDEFNLKDGDEETLIINFKLDDDLDLDFDEIEGNYRFYVIATGTIDDSDAGTFDDEGTCAFDFEDAEAIIESDFVVLDNIDFPEQIQCGETIEVTADVWNTGNRDQEDVSVFITNKELGLRGDILIGDIDEFDGQKLSFTFTIPRDAAEKTYALTFEVYDEDNDIYENDFDDDLSRFTFPLTVEGNCGMGVADVIISANLESEAKAGKDLVIKATITNNEDELKTFTVNAAGFAQWASSYNVDRTSLVLNAGESADVLFTFDVNKDASGSQSFTIELLSGDNQITTQPVSVVIEGKSGLLSSITTGNTYLWGIGILNIVLIVIIILVAVRIARRK